MSQRIVTEAEMQQRGRMLKLRSALTGVMEPHVADKMTPHEIIAVLADLILWAGKIGLQDELLDDQP